MLKLEVLELNEIEAKLRKLARELDDFDGLWERIERIMQEVTIEWFGTGGHGSWPPLSPATIEFKEEHGYPLAPLIRTGQMIDSLLDSGHEAAVGGLERSSGRSTLGTFLSHAFVFGTDAIDDRGRHYAHYHQAIDEFTGMPVDYGDNPPERQVIEWPLAESTEVLIHGAMEEYLDDVLRRAGIEA